MAENGGHGAAGVGRVVGTAEKMEAERVADVALAEEFEGLHHGGLEAGGVVDHEALTGGFSGGDHAVALLDGLGHGLFDEDMAARFEGLQGEWAMGDGRSEDMDRVQIVGQEAGEVGDGVGDVELGGEGLGAFGGRVSDGDDFDVGGIAKGDEVAFGDVAGADEADAEFRHGYWGLRNCRAARGWARKRAGWATGVGPMKRWGPKRVWIWAQVWGAQMRPVGSGLAVSC